MNKMPELKSGMIIEYELKSSSTRSTHVSMFINCEYLLNLNGDSYLGGLKNDTVVLRVWGARKYSLRTLNETDWNSITPLWEHKSEEEEKLEGIISDLEQNLADARERLEALK